MSGETATAAVGAAVAQNIANPGSGPIPVASALIISIATLITSGNIRSCGWSVWVLLTWIFSIVLLAASCIEGTAMTIKIPFLQSALSLNGHLLPETRGQLLTLWSLLVGVFGIVTFFTWTKPESPPPKSKKKGDDDDDDEEEDKTCGAYGSRISLLFFSVLAVVLSGAVVTGQLDLLVSPIFALFGKTPPAVSTKSAFSFFNRSG